MATQFKKLLYNKRFVDTGTGETLAKWSLSPWKVFFAMMAIAIALIIIYGLFFTPEGEGGGSGSGSFFGNVVFYSIVLVIAIAIIWITANTALKFKKILAGFMIAFILILVFYWFLGFLFGHFGIIDFHMGGYTLWILITVLAGLGAKRIDGSLDRNDVGYGLLVFIVLIGANIPVNNGVGFLANMDNLFSTIVSFIPW